jgi:putative lipoic acid-binding regulatory protein
MNEPNQHQETSLIEFPCAFTIKTFGKATEEYEVAVLKIIQKHAADSLNENSVRQRYSRDKNYLALSVTIQAQNKQQLDQIYQALTEEPLVTMAL